MDNGKIVYAAIREDIPVFLVTNEDVRTLEAYGFDLKRRTNFYGRKVYQCTTDCLVLDPQIDCTDCSGFGCAVCDDRGYIERAEEYLYRTLQGIVKKGGDELPCISMEIGYGQEYPVEHTSVGGSAIFITADAIYEMDTESWLREMGRRCSSGQDLATPNVALAA